MSLPSDLLRKSEIAMASARHLLERADVEGAADRAYYALFHAARALLAAAVPEEYPRLKTHSSLIAAFGLVAVKGLGLPAGYGRLLNFAEELRLKADYDAAVFADVAAIEEILAGAREFVEAVRFAIAKLEEDRP